MEENTIGILFDEPAPYPKSLALPIGVVLGSMLVIALIGRHLYTAKRRAKRLR